MCGPFQSQGRPHVSPSLFDAYVPPEDGYAGTWVGRAWVPGDLGGPVRQ